VHIPSAELLEAMRKAKLLPAISLDSDSEYDPVDLQDELNERAYEDERLHWARNYEILLQKLGSGWMTERLLDT
jgi:hypothetical protein